MHNDESGFVLEVCVESLANALRAKQSGADRIELCHQLACGGVTPSLVEVRNAIEQLDCPVVVLVRPHGGGFEYDDREKKELLHTLDMLSDAGVTGFAVGAVADTAWDRGFLEAMTQVAPGREFVAHRAIDQLIGCEPLEMDRMEQIVEPLIEMGFSRILTSGGYASAWQGATNIAKLVEYAKDRIEILAGGGIIPENALAILRETHVRQIHGSFKRLDVEQPRIDVDIDQVREVRSLLDGLT
jgi:copper homeostasis protein